MWRKAGRAVMRFSIPPGQAALVVSRLPLVRMELNLSRDYLLPILSDSLGRESHVAPRSPGSWRSMPSCFCLGTVLDPGHPSILSLRQGPASRDMAD